MVPSPVEEAGTANVQAPIRKYEQQAVSNAYAKAGGNRELEGYGFLRGWIDEACAGGIPPSAFIQTLQERVNQIR